VDAALISEQWDQLIRIAASLKDRTAPAHVVLQRLINVSPADGVSKALTALGRVCSVAGGAVIGVLGGLIGLGGAEFRPPLLIGIFRFAALQAVITRL
jgi:hypothetical protein